MPLPDAIRGLVRFLMQVTKSREGLLFIRHYDAERQPAEVCRVYDAEGKATPSDGVPFARSVAGSAASLGQPCLMNDLQAIPAGSVELQSFEKSHKNLLAVPLSVASGIHVVIELFDKAGGFSAEDQQAARSAAALGTELMRQALGQRQTHQLLFDAVAAAMKASDQMLQGAVVKPETQAIDQLRAGLANTSEDAETSLRLGRGDPRPGEQVWGAGGTSIVCNPSRKRPRIDGSDDRRRRIHSMTLAEKTRDDRLAIVLDALLKQQVAGTPIDWAAVGRQHPDLVDEIKQLLAVGQMIDFVRLSPTVTATPPRSDPAAPFSRIQLPCTFGDYELLTEIGRGGMGVVYKAWDKPLNRHVALKMILRGIHATAADLGRFRSEAQAAGGLTHPNIVPIYQVGEQNGQAYFCMKIVEGKTLAAVMADKPLHPRQAAEYMIAIARAVQHAHDKGILHRDLKPSNILIDENNQPLVTDFGLAKRRRRREP